LSSLQTSREKITQLNPANPEVVLKKETTSKMIPNTRFCEKNSTE
jgi:hypothetical protein